MVQVESNVMFEVQTYEYKKYEAGITSGLANPVLQYKPIDKKLARQIVYCVIEF